MHSIHSTLMQLAQVWSKRSTCTARISVGAVIVDSSNRVIASGYNGSPSGFNHCDEQGCQLDSDGHCLTAIHAEENAILQCAINGISCKGTKMYTTHQPCVKCCLRIAQVGITEVVYRNNYGDREFSHWALRTGGVHIWRYENE